MAAASLKYTIVAACLSTAACAAARQLEPVVPAYPELLRSANVTGNVRARVYVNRRGGVDAIRVDSVGTAKVLFRSAVLSSFRALRFSPARTLGRPHSAELEYMIRFVLVRPDEPLKEGERLVAADSLSRACPKATARYEIVVCRAAVPTHFKVLH